MSILDTNIIPHDLLLTIAKGVVSTNSVGIMYGKINEYYEINECKFITAHLTRCVDMVNKVLSVKLYDDKGMYIQCDKTVDLYVNGFRKVKSNITALNIPLWSLPYDKFSIGIPYTDITPCFYKIEIETKMIHNDYRKMSCDNLLDIPIKQNTIHGFDIINDPINIISLGKVEVSTKSHSFSFTCKEHKDNVYISYDSSKLKQIMYKKGEIYPTVAYQCPYISSDTYPLNLCITYLDKKFEDGNYIFDNKPYIINSGMIGCKWTS
jgi:hypothetical protein